MKKVLLIAAVAALVIASIPAGAAYKYNWTTGFEASRYHVGELNPTPVTTTLGQDRWFNPDNASYTNEVPFDVVAGVGINGTNGAVERNGISAAARDMRVLNSGNKAYYKGYAKFWVYDPGLDTTQGRVETRVGVYSDKGANNAGYMATVQIEDATSRDPNYWYAQWTSSVGKLDGNAVSGGSGYTFTAGPAAPRVWGAWSYVMITWAYTYADPKNPLGAGNGTVKYYINQSTVTPNLTVNFDNTHTTRWPNFNNVAGIFVGNGMSQVSNSRPAVLDNIEFHGDAIPPVPEPSSLLALGTGAVGLLGLIRRRK